MFNKYNSVSSQFNKHSRQCRHYIVDATTNQFQDLMSVVMCQKKIQSPLTEPIEHSCRKQKDLRFANFLSLGKHVETSVTVVFE